MKHLKTYEENEPYWSDSLIIGDYVLVDLSDVDYDYAIKNNVPIDDRQQPAEIREIIDEEYGFRCIFKTGREFGVAENEIIRKLTPEEIEDYKITKTATKYNL